MKKITIHIYLPLFAALFILGINETNAQTLLTGRPTPNSSVYAFERDGNTIYMGGIFSQVNSLPHFGLARFDAVTGTLDSWSPSVNNNTRRSIENCGVSGREPGGGGVALKERVAHHASNNPAAPPSAADTSG